MVIQSLSLSQLTPTTLLSIPHQKVHVYLYTAKLHIHAAQTHSFKMFVCTPLAPGY